MSVIANPVSVPAGEPALGDHLELLARISQDFAASLDVDETMQKALSRIADSLDAEAASLFLLEHPDETLICRACVGPVNIKGLRIAAGQGIVGRSVSGNACQMVRDVRLDPDFARSVDEGTGFTTRSILCAPMSVTDRRVGAIELINKRSGDGLFSERDRHVLEAMASSAALAIINARLTSQLIVQETLRRELALAAEIQRSLLPAGRDDDFPVCGVNRAARSVSGDFFDIFTLADGRIGFNVGDVSGKGINAALLMAKTSSLYRCLGKTESNPGRLLAQVNRELCETGARGMFVTMVGGVFDPASGLVELANAGHEPPMLLQPGGGCTRFMAGAPPLGIDPQLADELGETVQRIELGDATLCIVTDGVTEWADDAGRMLGGEGFLALLRALPRCDLNQRLALLLEHLERPGVALHDDLTMLLIERGQTP
jgi:sigma-B regulation protein RsbU (phosphoserine phosphatase)